MCIPEVREGEIIRNNQYSTTTSISANPPMRSRFFLPKRSPRTSGSQRRGGISEGRHGVAVSLFVTLLVGALLGGSIVAYYGMAGSLLAASMSSTDCLYSLGTYRGNEYKSGSLSAPQCLVNSKFLKLSLHSVELPSGQVVHDWLWIDYHDRVNVLVQNAEGKFLVFEQTKYALEGRQSLAIVGGIVEPGEDAHETAKREVEEELHQECAEFHALGRYRTDVNRGVGWLNSFLATGCSTAKHHLEEQQSLAAQVGAADTEKQIVNEISLTQLQQAYFEGRFLEVQWTATIGLALRHPKLLAH